MPGSIPGSPTIFAVTSGAKNQPSGWFFHLMRDGLRGQTFESPNMRTYSFTHAITRQPPASAIHGLRAVDTGAPDLAQMRAHHADYIAALKSTGAVVVELPALEAFPDSLFVEDTALCLPEGAVVMRPGAPSRLGEAAEMAPHLRALYGDVRAVTGAENFIEAGDILTTETEILVGRSARTNAGGVAELAGIVADWGYRLREVFTPPGVLHFKTDCSGMSCFLHFRLMHNLQIRNRNSCRSKTQGLTFHQLGAQCRLIHTCRTKSLRLQPLHSLQQQRPRRAWLPCR